MTDNEPPSAQAMLDGAADQAQPPRDVAKQYDILPKLLPNLDRQLVFQLLDFLESEEGPSEEITRAKFESLKNTNMVDFVGELDAQLKNLDKRPPEYDRKKEEVLQRRALFEEETSKLTGLLEDSDVTSNLRSDKENNMKYLKEQHGVRIEEVNMLYDYGLFQYQCGDYAHAADLLYMFRILVSNLAVSPHQTKLTNYDSPPTQKKSHPPPGVNLPPKSCVRTGKQ